MREYTAYTTLVAHNSSASLFDPNHEDTGIIGKEKEAAAAWEYLHLKKPMSKGVFGVMEHTDMKAGATGQATSEKLNPNQRVATQS